MELPTTKRRSARQRAGRKRSIYYEGDSEDEDVRPHSDGASDDDFDAPEPARPPPRLNAQRPRKRVKRSAKPMTRSRKQKARPLGSFKAKQKKTAPTVQSTIPSDGVRPAWEKLPVDILRDIFVYATESLREQSEVSSVSVNWLMRTARKTCRAFAIPALEAFYVAPSFSNVLQPHYLLELMALPPDDTYIKYRYKVKRLKIDVKHLAYSAHQKALFNMSELVRETPNLQELEIVHPMDEPPYRPLKFQKWHYPLDLFETLDQSSIRLRNWRWSRDMIPQNAPDVMYRHMARIHQSDSFRHLHRLIICGFDYNDSAEWRDSPRPGEEPVRTLHDTNLASAISCLPSLKDLTFISCDIIMEDFLLRLPNTLERLELTNCLEVTSDLLRTYLAANGAQLRELVLNSNAALNLSFLTTLKDHCPKLESLVMDTTYYSERQNYNDACAFYDQLLTTAEVPRWPPTLRNLELSNLQKWSADAASTLFQSLLDAAPALPDLRRLSIQAHVDIAWRDRADFRDKWIDKLRSTFLHKTPPPAPHLCSFKRYREWKEELPLPQRRVLASEDSATSTSRRLDHVRITPRKAPRHLDQLSEPDTEDEEEPVRRRVQPRRSTRVAENLSLVTQSSAASDADTPEAESTSDFVQGLCEIVDIRIDNQRPRETQYTEANFLDSEVSGDEDWHSGAELVSDDGYYV